MQVGEEKLRKSIAAATDARARARLRVELASIVRARDPAAARDELTNAAREAGPTQALTLAAIAMARTLPPPERVAWLGGLARTGEGAVVPGIVVALAGAQLEADQPRDAARTLLVLARDEHLPLHHRRAAANKLVRLCDRIDPILGRVALYTAAMLATGKGRRTLLRRALALPATIETRSRAPRRGRRGAGAHPAGVDEVRRRDTARRRAPGAPARAQARVARDDGGGRRAGAPPRAPGTAAAGVAGTGPSAAIAPAAEGGVRHRAGTR